MATTDIFHISAPIVPARRAVRMLGGNVDDYVQVNAHAAARVAANDAVGTYSAWINFPNLTATGTIIGNGDDSAVEFLEVLVEAGKISVRITDATTAQLVFTTTNIVVTPHKWMHLAIVQGNDGIGPKFYINGVREYAITKTTATDVNSWFAELDGIDTARIGASNKAGDASVTNEFTGAISDLKYWSAALTDAQVFNDYNGVVNTTSLQEHWDFDDDYVSSVGDATTGTATGAIVLIPNYSEFSSRIGFQNSLTAPVVADVVVLGVSELKGHAIIIKAA